MDDGGAEKRSDFLNLRMEVRYEEGIMCHGLGNAYGGFCLG